MRTIFVLVVLCLVFVAGVAVFTPPAPGRATKCILDPLRDCTLCDTCKDHDNCCCKHVDRCSCNIPSPTGEKHCR